MKTLRKRAACTSALVLFVALLSFCMMADLKPTQAADESPLAFTAISGGYSVSLADKTAVEVRIPNEYNGLPVKEIKANGFLAASNLEKVIIPETVTKLNTSSFMNCTKLKYVHFATKIDVDTGNLLGITEIGQMAFSGCTSLEKIIIPSTISASKIHGMAFRNLATDITYRGEQAFSLTNFAGTITYSLTEIVYEDIQSGASIFSLSADEEVESIKAYAYQNIQSDEPIIIPYLVNGKRVASIECEAFSGTIAPSLHFSSDFADSGNTVYLEFGAFMDSQIVEIYLGSFVDVDENSMNLFAFSSVEKIYMPDNFQFIPAMMFYNCLDLQEIIIDGEVNILNSTIEYIGDMAFYYCMSLEDITIPATVVDYVIINGNETAGIGFYAFDGWFDPQRIYLEGRTSIPEEWTREYLNWLGDTDPEIVITDGTAIKVTFDTNNNLASDDFSISLEPPFTLNDLIAHENYIEPTSPNQVFAGWYLDSTYSTPCPLNYEFDEKTTIYAKWIVEVNFVGNQYVNYAVSNYTHKDNNKYFFDLGDIVAFTITVNQQYNQSTPVIYCNGTQLPQSGIYTIGNILENKEITIEPMSLNTYSISYNLNNGVNHVDNPSEYQVGSSIVLKTPTRYGYVFGGWYKDSTFTQTATGIGSNESGNKVFYAKWNTVSNNINYVLNGGVNHADNVIIYSVNDIVTLFDASRRGYNFLGWYETENFSGNKVTSFGSGSTGEKTFYAKWSDPIEYYITYTVNDNYGIVNPNPDKYTVEDLPMSLMDLTKRGYSFSWDIPYLTNDIELMDIEIVGTWSLNEYTITYNGDLKGQNNDENPTSYTVNDLPLVFKELSADGFTFNWSISELTEDAVLTNLIITAEWSAETIAICYDNSYGVVKTIAVAYDDMSFISSLPKPQITLSSSYFHFDGWYLDDFTTKITNSPEYHEFSTNAVVYIYAKIVVGRLSNSVWTEGTVDVPNDCTRLFAVSKMGETTIYPNSILMLSSRNADFSLYVDNLNATYESFFMGAGLGIGDYDVNVFVMGVNTIKTKDESRTGYSSQSVFQTQNIKLNIIFINENSELVIKSGDTPNGNSSPAMTAAELNVLMEAGGKFVIRGGNGICGGSGIMLLKKGSEWHLNGATVEIYGGDSTGNNAFGYGILASQHTDGQNGGGDINFYGGESTSTLIITGGKRSNGVNLVAIYKFSYIAIAYGENITAIINGVVNTTTSALLYELFIYEDEII